MDLPTKAYIELIEDERIYFVTYDDEHGDMSVASFQLALAPDSCEIVPGLIFEIVTNYPELTIKIFRWTQEELDTIDREAKALAALIQFE